MNERRDRGRWGGARRADQPDARHPEPKRDPGAYIGRMPERATETIPGGLGRRDVRVSAVATQPAPVRGNTGDGGASAEGHREGANATDDAVREAGENR